MGNITKVTSKFCFQIQNYNYYDFKINLFNILKEKSEKVKGIDLDGEGDIDGKPVLQVDIESILEKPWRQKGVNQSEFFNYGFNEETWKIYQVLLKYMKEQIEKMVELFFGRH